MDFKLEMVSANNIALDTVTSQNIRMTYTRLVFPPDVTLHHH